MFAAAYFWIWSRVRRTSCGYVATEAIILDVDEQRRIVLEGMSEPSSGPANGGSQRPSFRSRQGRDVRL